jgi:hypothetical protein
MIALGVVAGAGNAAAEATVDLLWQGVSGSTTNVLDVEPGDPGATESGLSCGPVTLGEGQRCLFVLLSITDPSDEFTIGLTFDDTQLSGSHIAMLPLPFPWDADPAATASTPTFGEGVAGPFRATTSLGDAPPGTYTVGAVVFDTSGITASTAITSRPLGAGVLGDGVGDLQPTSFGSAFLHVVPEPATAVLLGCGLLALGAIGRRRAPAPTVHVPHPRAMVGTAPTTPPTSWV